MHMRRAHNKKDDGVTSEQKKFAACHCTRITYTKKNNKLPLISGSLSLFCDSIIPYNFSSPSEALCPHYHHHHHHHHSHSSFLTCLVGNESSSSMVLQGQPVVRNRSPILLSLEESFVAVLKFLVTVSYLYFCNKT
jgi:hypothetical protein